MIESWLNEFKNIKSVKVAKNNQIKFFIKNNKFNYKIISPTPIRCIEHCAKSVQIRSYFWSAFSRIWTEYGEIPRIVRMRENTDQK